MDSRLVVLMSYDSGGVLTKVEAVTDPRTVADCCRWRDVAMHRAIPVGDYMRRETCRRAASVYATAKTTMVPCSTTPTMSSLYSSGRSSAESLTCRGEVATRSRYRVAAHVVLALAVIP